MDGRLFLYISFLYNQLTRFVGFQPRKTKRRWPDHTLTITYKIVWYTNVHYKNTHWAIIRKQLKRKKLFFFLMLRRVYWQWVITTFYLNKKSFCSFLCLTGRKKFLSLLHYYAFLSLHTWLTGLMMMTIGSPSLFVFICGEMMFVSSNLLLFRTYVHVNS